MTKRFEYHVINNCITSVHENSVSVRNEYKLSGIYYTIVIIEWFRVCAWPRIVLTTLCAISDIRASANNYFAICIDL